MNDICPCRVSYLKPQSSMDSRQSSSESSKETRYEHCCAQVHKDHSFARTAEMLMRARYSAFVLKLHDFLVSTIDPSTRQDFDHEANKDWAEQAQFLGLEIEKVRNLGAKAQVQFSTEFELDGKRQTHRELSSFERKNGKWYFAKGKIL